MDPSGHLAAVTSTGGVGNETPGRVGDTPTVAGNYAVGDVAVSCTGTGEQIVRLAFAARVAERVALGMSLEKALQMGLEKAVAQGDRLAAIALQRLPDGGVSWAAGGTTDRFTWGRTDGGPRA